ncbi:MAG: hypothetical protein H0V57_10425 [Thermoleophilaceae bacterium]|nr:hypothetical protein [Thermoleophilaceae bacterium]
MLPNGAFPPEAANVPRDQAGRDPQRGEEAQRAQRDLPPPACRRLRLTCLAGWAARGGEHHDRAHQRGEEAGPREKEPDQEGTPRCLVGALLAEGGAQEDQEQQEGDPEQNEREHAKCGPEKPSSRHEVHATWTRS